MTKIINLTSIDSKLPKYLKLFNIDSLKELSLEQGNKFLVKIIQDFKNGELSLDELSVFGFNIFHEIAKNKNEGSDLFFTSLSISELNFNIRVKESYRDIVPTLEEMDTFFDKYNS